MDDERFEVFYALLRTLSPRRGKRCQYSDGDILLVLIWAALRQKPIAWACRRRNAPQAWRGRTPPSASRVSRRLREPKVAALLDLATLHLQQRVLVASALVGCWMIDAKGLPVSRFSKDRQAKWGYATGGKARGYKLFLLADARGSPVAWRVGAMNVAEQAVARELIAHIDGPGYLLGDAVYDVNDLYEQAAAKQVQLVAPRKEPGAAIGRRARGEARLHAIAMLETPVNRFGPSLLNERNRIERVFARWSSSAVGLDHLPGWVRGERRVRRWVHAKILIALSLDM